MGKRIVALASMQPGQKGRIVGMHVAEDIRQRLRDVGFVQGNGIECVYDSPFGDPVAYFVRGVLIAVRKEDAEKIEVETEWPPECGGEGKRMGLSNVSVEMEVTDCGSEIKKKRESDIIVALAGNPNVGKSTVFNVMTGMHQHTGNWAGKTVTNAQGYASYGQQGYVLVDIPGCYSLHTHSAEEEVARDFICSGIPDVVAVVCDAVCLERSLGLVLQILELTGRVVVCVNLMDEAQKKHIRIDLQGLQERLGVPVVGTAARSGVGLEAFCQAIDEVAGRKESGTGDKGITGRGRKDNKITGRERKDNEIRGSERKDNEITESGRKDNRRTDSGRKDNERTGYGYKIQKEDISGGDAVAELCQGIIIYEDEGYLEPDRRKDRVFTGKRTAVPIMFLLLLGTFWLTIVGANYPSELLRTFFSFLEGKLMDGFVWLGVPEALRELLVYGVYRVVAWIVAVMLPPMAIFFPLFTIMEDSGYLPRVAFNLDKCFRKCHACGKQSLTMAMGFGCNAAGVVGCRIIDSPRERLIAVITNSFVPCNGRFPALIAIIIMFFAGGSAGAGKAVVAALILAGFIMLGIGMTFFVSWLLSVTVLKGMPSSFVLELPPYRRPQIGRVVVRSVCDRTMFVLGRAVAAAAPAGAILWLFANIRIDGVTLLAYVAGALQPFAALMGLDGVILLAFILGMPANEIVVPIIIMAYLSQGTLVEISDNMVLKQLLVDNGWTWTTAVCTMLFSLFHWPCATTCLTIHKETGSLKWTLLSMFIPTAAGCIVCMAFHFVVKGFALLL